MEPNKKHTIWYIDKLPSFEALVAVVRKEFPGIDFNQITLTPGYMNLELVGPAQAPKRRRLFKAEME